MDRSKVPGLVSDFGGIDPGPWRTYTPTVTAGSGTFTSVSATGRWRRFGRIIFWQTTITITTIGSAATSLIFTLPVAAVANQSLGWGIENAVNGMYVTVVSGDLDGSDTSHGVVRRFDDAHPNGSGYVHYLTGTYEAAS